MVSVLFFCLKALVLGPGLYMIYVAIYVLMVVVSFLFVVVVGFFCLMVLVGCVNDGSCVFCFMVVAEFLC